MTDGGPRPGDASIAYKAHAYDPIASPALFDGVLQRRVIAFLIDFTIIALPVVIAFLLMAAMTIVTFGVAGVLFALLSPLFWPMIVIWALCYYGLTLGSRASATIGMRAMDLEMHTWYGSPAYFVVGAAHGLFFWMTIWFPIVLIVPLFNSRRRLLHDILLGVIVINSPARARMRQDAHRA